ncbi:TonB-dependent receptor [Maribacter sp.]|uniref:TonB-dependent receptor n=1 Tax=Maribacter sp. TaxID=1897614 RepID=UPI0025C126E2|nr:TonB-dependent receptor [Maribacter sp.]
MKKQYYLLLIFLTTISMYSQEYILEGQVNNGQNEPLIGVNITNNQNSYGTQTDTEGNFTLTLNKVGNYELTLSHLGYKTKNVLVSVSATNEYISVTMNPDNFSLNEVVITSRSNDKIDEIPSSVTVLNRKEVAILSQNANTLADVIDKIPGISLSTGTNRSRGQNMRGRNMLILIDGIPQSTPLFKTNKEINTIDPSVIEKIEVVRGATAIYGNGAEGGVVNFITKNINPNKSFESTTRFGSTGSLVNTKHTMGTLISQGFSGTKNKLGYVINGSYESTGIMRGPKNEIQSPDNGVGETQRYNFFGKLKYDINENNSVGFVYNYFSSNQSTNLKRVNGVYGESPVTGAFSEPNSVEEDQGTRFNHNFQFTFLSKNIFKNTDLSLNLYSNKFETVYAWYAWWGNNTKGGTISGGQSRIQSSKKGARLNLNSSYRFSDKISGNLVYGIDFMGDETKQTTLDGRTILTPMNMVNFAPFIQNKTTFNDFVIKVGLRYEKINIGIDDYTTLKYNDGNVNNGGIKINGNDLKYNAITFNSGLRYNKIKVFKPFVSFSQSFSVAEIGREVRVAKDPDLLLKFAPEAIIVNNYEIGASSELGANTTLQATYFISTSELGSSWTASEESAHLEVTRAAERIHGYEIQFNTRFAEKFNFGISHQGIEGKADANDDGDTTDKEDVYLNSRRINPSITRTYLGYDLNSKLNIKISTVLTGSRDRFEPNAEGKYGYGYAPVKSFNYSNLYASYDVDEKIKFQLGITNLFNQDFYTTRSQWAGYASSYEKANGARFNLSVLIKL